MNPRVLTMAVFPALACGPGSPPASAEWTVHPHGIGHLRAGMPLNEIVRLLGVSATPNYDVYDARCAHVSPVALPAGVHLMLVNDTLVRVEIRDTTTVTEEGARVGTPEARLLDLYAGRVRVRPHAYSGPQWHYVVVDAGPNDTSHAMIFETDGQTIQQFRAGRRPEVEWVEGCL